MGISIFHGDITNLKVDAIVNSANRRPICGNGIDTTIYMVAGIGRLFQARYEIGAIEPGQALATPSFALAKNEVKHIIHTVAPVWEGDQKDELQTLGECYRNSLEAALQLNCSSVAFPLLATGSCGFPKDKAISVAIDAFDEFLRQHDMKIILVLMDEHFHYLPDALMNEVRGYIDEEYLAGNGHVAYSYTAIRKEQNPDFDNEDCASGRKLNRGEYPIIQYSIRLSPKPPAYLAKEVKEELGGLDGFITEPLAKTFQERLAEIMAERKLKAPQVYKNYVSKEVFSKLMSNKTAKPQKGTALAICLSLKLNVEETNDMLERAGYVLSKSSLFDMVVKACIEKGIYNKTMVDIILDDYKCPELLSARS